MAKDLGNEKTLTIYKDLLKYTEEVTFHLNADKNIYWTNTDPSTNSYFQNGFQTYLQSSGDLGQRMKNAFAEQLMNAQKVVIIGTDCPYITKEILDESFDKLDECDIVLGPAKDGGYYLLGMKETTPEIFECITWSTSSVLKDTLTNVKSLRKKYILLKELSDIDTISDLTEWQKSNDPF
ncbi:TIGR04282 family arsenosugar biosynthesis glycosyltransferase [Leptospira sp. 96542]|nr:TIGR04282 family arsenosugar biosynthesis glycosyltransferase [Leptospira sp. 96542]